MAHGAAHPVTITTAGAPPSPTIISTMEGLGATLGAMYTAGGVGGLLGPPIAGFLQDATDSYTSSILGAMAVAALGVLVLRRAIRLAGSSQTGPLTTA